MGGTRDWVLGLPLLYAARRRSPAAPGPRRADRARAALSARRACLRPASSHRDAARTEASAASSLAGQRRPRHALATVLKPGGEQRHGARTEGGAAGRSVFSGRNQKDAFKGVSRSEAGHAAAGRDPSRISGADSGAVGGLAGGQQEGGGGGRRQEVELAP